MKTEFEAALTAFFSSNINHENGERQDYAIRLHSLSADGRVAVIEHRFLAEKSYCCFEHGCHCWLFSESGWLRFRELLGEESKRFPYPLELLFKVTVEAGARALVNERVFGLGPSKGYHYEVVYTEKPDPGE